MPRPCSTRPGSARSSKPLQRRPGRPRYLALILEPFIIAGLAILAVRIRQWMMPVMFVAAASRSSPAHRSSSAPCCSPSQSSAWPPRWSRIHLRTGLTRAARDSEPASRDSEPHALRRHCCRACRRSPCRRSRCRSSDPSSTVAARAPRRPISPGSRSACRISLFREPVRRPSGGSTSSRRRSPGRSWSVPSILALVIHVASAGRLLRPLPGPRDDLPRASTSPIAGSSLVAGSRRFHRILLVMPPVHPGRAPQGKVPAPEFTKRTPAVRPQPTRP